jgi:hypothetical protein
MSQTMIDFLQSAAIVAMMVIVIINTRNRR